VISATAACELDGSLERKLRLQWMAAEHECLAHMRPALIRQLREETEGK